MHKKYHYNLRCYRAHYFQTLKIHLYVLIYNVCLEEGSNDIGSAFCEPIYVHFLYIPLYTNRRSDILQTLIEVHFVA